MAVLSITKGKDYFYYGGDGSGAFHLNQKTASEWLVGRKREHALAIRGAGISFDHAKISFHGSKFWLEDLNTRGGTYLNDQRIQEKVVIPDGARLKFGKAEVTFHYNDPMEGSEDQANIPKLQHSTSYTPKRRRRYTQRSLEGDPGIPTYARSRSTEGGRIQQIRDELKKVTKERDELKAEIESLRDSQSDVEQMKNSVEERLQTAAEQLAMKSAQIVQLETNCQVLQNNLKLEADKVMAQLAMQQKKREELEKHEDRLKSKIEILDAKNRELMDRLTLQKALQQAESSSGAEKQVEELEKRNAQLERALEQLRSQKEELRGQLDQAQGEVEGLAQAVAGKSGRSSRRRRRSAFDDASPLDDSDDEPVVSKSEKPKSLFDGL